MTFKNLDDQEIRFIQGGLKSQSQIDSEVAEIIELLINGNESILVIKEDTSFLCWSIQEEVFCIQGNLECLWQNKNTEYCSKFIPSK